MSNSFFNPVFQIYNQALSDKECKTQYETQNDQGETMVFDDYDAADVWGNGTVATVRSKEFKEANDQAIKHFDAIKGELDKIPSNKSGAKTWQLASTQADLSKYGVDRYRLERIDVGHRMGDYLVNAWEEFRKTTVKNPDFWQWVSDQAQDDNKVKSWNPTLYTSAQQHPEYVSQYLKWFRAGVKYISETQDRDRYWVEVKDGNLWRRLQRKDMTRTKFDTQKMIEHVQKKYKMSLSAIWVLSPADRFYGHVVKIGRFHHSSLLAGTEIQAAGEWGVENGKLKWINGKSGHYRPELERFIDGLELLLKGKATADDAKVRLYEKGKTEMKLEEPVETFLKSVKSNPKHYAPLEIFS